jgi:hypothetical protein
MKIIQKLTIKRYFNSHWILMCIFSLIYCILDSYIIVKKVITNISIKDLTSFKKYDIIGWFIK